MTKEDLGHLIIASTDSLYRISKSILRNETDCEDAVSEAIVKSFDKINTLQHASYAKTWLVRILINECHNIGRRLKRVTPVEKMPDQPVWKENLSDEADYSELYHAMMQLDDKYRIPVELYYIEGYKIHEITDILNRSEGTIKSQLARGRQQLRKYLESEAAQ